MLGNSRVLAKLGGSARTFLTRMRRRHEPGEPRSHPTFLILLRAS